MPPSLTLSDFKLFQSVCEIRYENAYLIYDRTGQIFHQIRPKFTDLRVLSAVPNQSGFQSSEGNFALELNASRFTSTKPDSKLETFGQHCKIYFDAVISNLDIKVFTRVGLRLFFRKEYRTLGEAKDALTSLKLTNLGIIENFGLDEPPSECMYRWEGSQTGVLLRSKAESGKIDLVLPPELEAPNPEIHKEIIGLVLDADYYTVAPVDRGQWNAEEWIHSSSRHVKKGIDEILSF